MDADDLAGRLRDRFPDILVARGEVTAIASPDDLLPGLRYLREDPDLSFGFLSDLTVSDWPELDPRFWVAYHLRSIERGHRIRLKVGLPPEPDPPHLPSITPLYPAADWLEREAYDFFGVVFDGHPDLRRIEMPDDWVGHPLRKTEPLAGVNTAFNGAFIPPPDQRGL